MVEIQSAAAEIWRGKEKKEEEEEEEERAKIHSYYIVRP